MLDSGSSQAEAVAFLNEWLKGLTDKRLIETWRKYIIDREMAKLGREGRDRGQYRPGQGSHERNPDHSCR